MDRDELLARLQQMEEGWKDAPVGGGGLFDLPEEDGEYQAVINMFDFLEFDVKGARMAHLKIQLQLENTPDGKYDGRLPGLLYNLEDVERLKYLKADMATLGVDVENTPISEFVPGSDTLNSLLDNRVLVVVKTSTRLKENGQPYRNMYLQESFGHGGAPVTSDVTGQDALDGFTVPAGANAVDDDIPF